MTIAIAALCGWPNDVAIIAVEDRMITAGDIEFEQPQPKIWRLSEHSLAMFFGLTAAQAQIASLAEAHIASHAIQQIDQIAATYAWYWRNYVRLEAEADVLAPLGLTSANLLKLDSSVNPTLASSLVKQMQSYYLGSGLADNLGGAIIIGADDSGAHIFQVENGKTTFMNGIGFAAAGSGQWHAQSQFMFSKYSKVWRFADALSLLYAAKKRAEASPGVGLDTDLVVVTTNPRNVIHARSDSEFVQGLETIYQEHKLKQDEDFASQHRSVKAFVDELLAKSRPQSAPELATEQAQQPSIEPTDDSRATPQPASDSARGRRARKRVLQGSRRGSQVQTPSPE